MTTLANAKHEQVALAYIADPERVGWRAYRSVYPKSSQGAAESSWSALLRNPKFSARIAEFAEAAAEGAVMSAREVLEELTRIARANMLDYMRVGPGGDPVLDFSRLTRDQAAALQEVTVEDFLDARSAGDVMEAQGRGGALRRPASREVRRVKFRLADKIEALELLGKHHKLYVERHLHDFSAGVAERLAAALARVDGRVPSIDSEGRRDRRPASKRVRAQGSPKRQEHSGSMRQPAGTKRSYVDGCTKDGRSKGEASAAYESGAGKETRGPASRRRHRPHAAGLSTAGDAGSDSAGGPAV